jgi:hypothetical protein
VEAICSRAHEQGNYQEAAGVGQNNRDSSINHSGQTRSAQRPDTDSYVVQEGEETRAQQSDRCRCPGGSSKRHSLIRKVSREFCNGRWQSQS